MRVLYGVLPLRCCDSQRDPWAQLATAEFNGVGRFKRRGMPAPRDREQTATASSARLSDETAAT